MNEIVGLKEYVNLEHYRKALGLPRDTVVEYQLLAQGEYNRNYLFVHPVTGQQLILRINCASQMQLANQIQYEFDSLLLLRGSGRTPVPYYVDASLSHLPFGIMVMEFLPGHALCYRTELAFGAECLADIHSVKVDGNSHLIKPQEPLKAILDECEAMFKVYADSPLGEANMKKRIRSMLNLGWQRLAQTAAPISYRCCINTELNSTNFLIGGHGQGNYLIDWEKPVYGDPAQDLGHFLAPTTTFWKTDVILTSEEMNGFLALYLQHVDGRFPVEGLRERTHAYIPITCLRGITWCAMAWVEYQQPDKLLFNQSTWQKLNAYLAEDFLDGIEPLLRS